MTPLHFNEIATQIIELKNADLAFREKLIETGQLGKGYHKEMAQIHNSNAKILNDIIDNIGYPTADKVGEEACEASWLIIQHAIGQPAFMKRCLALLEVAMIENKADPKHLAYLTDRIAVLEGKPQCHGTQFDWDENGALVPNHYDDLKKVNERRKSIGLNTLEEQTAIIQRRAKNENQSPPSDHRQRKMEFENWKKSVGWVNASASVPPKSNNNK